MQSGKIPTWMRESSYRDFAEDAKPIRRLKTWTLMGLIAVFAALSVITAFAYPEAFHLPVIAACLAAFVALVLIPRESDYRMALTYWVLAIGLNCLFALIALKEDTHSFMVALAGIILFTGLAGLLILSRTKEKLSKLVKSVTMFGFVATSVASFMFGVEPSEGIPKIMGLWLFAAIAPMIFLTVMAFLVLVAYHWKSVTLPHHKWT